MEGLLRMDAVVYIGHGSRSNEGNAQFITFVQSVMKEIPFQKQKIAFLELVKPTINETLEKLIEEGAERILVVPVLLFAAAHHKQDIPEAIKVVQGRYPHVSFVITDPFDVHSNMIELVVKRVKEIANEQARHAVVLLVGRGSSDPEPIAKLHQIGCAVEKRLHIPVYEAYLTSYKPTVDNALAHLKQKYEKVYVMPYLLFTGLLLKKIEQYVSECEANIKLCQNLQYDELMKEVLVQRIEEKCMPWSIYIQ